MSRKKKLKAHDLALAFPPMAREEFRALVEDIAVNGLQEPIVRFEGKVLDGWHRYQGCLEAGVEPRFIEFAGTDPLGFVTSKNLKRRSLSPSQRAAWGVLNLLPDAREKAKERQAAGVACSNGRKAAEGVAEVVGVGSGLVEDCARVQREREDLFLKVMAGEETVAGALRIIRAGNYKALRNHQNKNQSNGNGASKPETEPVDDAEPEWVASIRALVSVLLCIQHGTYDLPRNRDEVVGLVGMVRREAARALKVVREVA